MVDITHKSGTLRTAIAQAIVKVGSQHTIDLINQHKIPKGNIFEMSKAAGLFAVKKTADMIPDCHPLPVEYTDISHEIQGLQIVIKVKVKTIYKTGVEVEAMHGASVVALTIYDMLKPVDKQVEIEHIKLLIKTGGKSDYKVAVDSSYSASLIICSDSTYEGKKEDKVSSLVSEKLRPFQVEITDKHILPDDRDEIHEYVHQQYEKGVDILILIGGSGLTTRDTTPEALLPWIDKRVPGIEETMRRYAQKRTPFAMLSRSVVGIKGKTLVLALSGSTEGVKNSIDALFPHVLQVFKEMEF